MKYIARALWLDTAVMAVPCLQATERFPTRSVTIAAPQRHAAAPEIPMQSLVRQGVDIDPN